MKVSREQAEKNRERVVDTAAKLFREHGYNGIGVADLMKAAGLTNGAFYGNFNSKEDLMVEACARTFENSASSWARLAAKHPDAPFEAITASYLSPKHRDNPGAGCAVVALGPEVARLSSGVRDALTDGVRQQLDQLIALAEAESSQEKRDAVLVAYASMVGALMLSRAVNEPGLSDEFLRVVRQALSQSQT